MAVISPFHVRFNSVIYQTKSDQNIIYQNVASKLLFWIFKILKILKIVLQFSKFSRNNQQKILFSRNVEYNCRIFRNRIICERVLSGVLVYKISSRYLEKCPSFGILKVENGHFLRYFRRCLYFFYF